MIRNDRWVKSSRSSGNGGACVEVRSTSDTILLRDSKLGDASPVLPFSREAWRTFVQSVKA